MKREAGAEDRSPGKKFRGIVGSTKENRSVSGDIPSNIITLVTFIFQMNMRGTERLNHLTKAAQHSAAQAQLEARPSIGKVADAGGERSRQKDENQS